MEDEPPFHRLAGDLKAAGNSSDGEAQRVLQSMKQLKVEVSQYTQFSGEWCEDVVTGGGGGHGD